MQEVRVDGFDRLDPLETAHAEPTLGPLPLPQPEFPNYPLAIVEWHDAWFDLDLESPDVCRQDYLVRTVGFLVGEGPRFVSARPGDPAGRRGSPRRHAHPAADRRTRDPAGTVGRALRPAGPNAPRIRVDSTRPKVLTRTTTRKEGCTMAETALTVLPHPSGIGR